MAGDPAVIDRLATLPQGKRQPNLVFAAARWCGTEPGPYAALRDALLQRWSAVERTVLARRTQTNEAGRCATLLPVLGQVAALGRPLALLEVGASAGLCLLPDRYAYAYSTGHRLQPSTPLPARTADADGPAGGPPVLGCTVRGSAPIPADLPQVTWRAGIDLSPVDVTDDEAVRWLETLIWPEHADRRERLRAAVRVARRDPPRVVAGDLNDRLAAVAAQAPDEATLVVFHTAVLAYLSEPERAAYVEQVRELPGHWVSQEGARVLPEVTATLPRRDPPDDGAPREENRFVLALDGAALALVDPHGRLMTWLGDHH